MCCRPCDHLSVCSLQVHALRLGTVPVQPLPLRYLSGPYFDRCRRLGQIAI